MVVLSGIRNLMGVAKSSERNQPPMFTLPAVGLNSSIVSVGGGVSVWVRTSLITMPGNTGGAGSGCAGAPLTTPLGRQFVLLSQASGAAFSLTIAKEKPAPAVIGYQSFS